MRNWIAVVAACVVGSLFGFCCPVKAESVVTTMPGAHPPLLRMPARVAFDSYAGVAVNGLSAFFVSDWERNSVFRIDSQGRSELVVGDGKPVGGQVNIESDWGDGGDPKAARLFHPEAVAVSPSGEIVIAEPDAHRVRVVSADRKRISTLAGKGVPGSSGDGGPAADALLNTPRGVAVLSDGRVVIAEKWGVREMSTDPSRTIRKIAGGGPNEPTVSPQLATEIRLADLAGISVAQRGDLLIATGKQVLRMHGKRLSVIAGTRFAVEDQWGSDGVATDAKLIHAEDVVELPDGRILIADRGHRKIRCLNAEGWLSTFAGADYSDKFIGDNLPATQTSLMPTGVAIAPFGVLVADGRDGLVRLVNLRDEADEVQPNAEDLPAPPFSTEGVEEQPDVGDTNRNSPQLEGKGRLKRDLPMLTREEALKGLTCRMIITGHLLDLFPDNRYYLKRLGGAVNGGRRWNSPLDGVPRDVKWRIWFFAADISPGPYIAHWFQFVKKLVVDAGGFWSPRMDIEGLNGWAIRSTIVDPAKFEEEVDASGLRGFESRNFLRFISIAVSEPTVRLVNTNLVNEDHLLRFSIQDYSGQPKG